MRSSSLVVEESTSTRSSVARSENASEQDEHTDPPSVSRPFGGGISFRTKPTLPRRVRFEIQGPSRQSVRQPHDRASMERQARMLQQQIAHLQDQINTLVANNELG